MKSKLILVLGAVAVTTLSFTFASTNKPVKANRNAASSGLHSEPVGGLGMEDPR